MAKVMMTAMIPNGIAVVGESGITKAADVQYMATAGVNAVLVGETLVTSGDPAAAIRDLAGRAC